MCPNVNKINYPKVPHLHTVHPLKSRLPAQYTRPLHGEIYVGLDIQIVSDKR